jgi:predicted transcriptional regulator YdeE
METIDLKDDIIVFYMTAENFPEGIQQTFDTLTETVPDAQERTYFGISNGAPNGKIVYKAAIQAHSEEKVPAGCSVQTIHKGRYRAITITDWRNHMNSFSEAFMTLLKDPDMDTTHPCVEWYHENESVRCMIRLRSL